MALKSVTEITISISEVDGIAGGQATALFRVNDVGLNGSDFIEFETSDTAAIIAAAKEALKAKLEEGGHTTEGI